ncbi:hypothetical protein [Psychrobacter pacificensis]|uniref:hypothetical protein n=1 Tax=Psychrobacter pacificensis TaxID=112002 RepID=UPI000E84A5F4|nr:hypothetical protein [Psychrobacter pacificensis]MBZ1392826.1 hypothetical protein [Psychrobacter pacificensis]HBD03510.1 hypothetical protein [Psychrobacter sp.]|tara:strand:+ start:11725 stop:12009 length:285 start_codon:yes stop_codon:yes gene_type:complete
MTDTLIMFALATVVTLVSTVFWRWVSSISQVQEKNGNQIDTVAADVAALKAEVYRDYQSKNESRHDNEQILEMLREIKTNVSKLNDKLDKKADK